MEKIKLKKKILWELGLWVGIPALLYITGYHVHVISAIQGIVIDTGIVQPSLVDEKIPIAMSDLQWRITNLDGETMRLESFKGKVIFINMWASWCGPCRAELPEIDNLYRKNTNPDLVFIIMSLDKDPDTMYKYLENNDFTFPVYRTYDQLPGFFNAGSIPTSYLIDKKGNLVMKTVGIASYDTPEFRDYLDRLASGGQQQSLHLR